MTQDEIIEMARQCGFEQLSHDDCDLVCYPEEVEAFAKLVAAKERECIIEANAPELEKANAHIKRLEEQAYDLLGELKVANIKLSMRPQRTWVGLTDEDEIDWEEGGNLKDLVKAIEAKLKGKNL